MASLCSFAFSAASRSIPSPMCSRTRSARSRSARSLASRSERSRSARLKSAPQPAHWASAGVVEIVLRTVIFAHSLDLANREIINGLSRRGQVLLCRFQDGSDEPAAKLMGARNGNRLWEISTSTDVLSVRGAPPPEFTLIRERFRDRISEKRLVMDEFVLELGKALCGFRHEQEQKFKGLRVLPDSPLLQTSIQVKPAHSIWRFIHFIFIEHPGWFVLVTFIFCMDC